MAIAMVSSVLACVGGTYVSYYFDLSTGGSIVADIPY
ncbi:MAG: metal ABC transporter permease [Synechocystis sp.]|jgi:ABC-type Mn2+/Zn2+ transport system permease subunit